MNDISNLPAERVTRDQAAGLKLGGGHIVEIKSVAEARDFAMLMATADIALPKHLRNRPGVCLAVVIQAAQWKADPFQVANKSYSVNDRLAYEAQLYAALLLSSGLIKGRPRYSYEGETGSTRRCTVTLTLADGSGTLEYTSPPVSKIQPKNSPLWKTDEDQQLGYYSIRACGRRDFPDVLLGFVTTDDVAELPADTPPPAAPVKSSTVQKLDALAGVARATATEAVEEAEIVSDAPVETTPAPADAKEKPAARRGRPPKAAADAKAATPTDLTQGEVAAVVQEPLVQQALSTFPGSQVVDVRATDHDEEAALAGDGASEIWGEMEGEAFDDGGFAVPESDEEERIQTRMGELDHVPVGIDQKDLEQCRQYLEGYDAGLKGMVLGSIPREFGSDVRKPEGVAWLLGYSAAKKEGTRLNPPMAARFVEGMIAALAGKPLNVIPEELRVEERKFEYMAWITGHDTISGDSPAARKARKPGPK